jgi:hypothetical protein
MRLPRLSPSVERRSPVLFSANPPRGGLRLQGLEKLLSGDEVDLLITITSCLLKTCSTNSDCAGNGLCTTCSGGVCKN